MGRWYVAVSLVAGLLADLVAASGCGDNNSTPGAWTSGDRYRADVYVGAGGATVLRGWYDLYLDLDCTSQQLAQPGGCARVGHVFYADVACSKPWVDDGDLPSPASYYQGVGGYYKVTNFEPQIHEQFFIDGTGSCRDGHVSSHGYSAQIIDASTFGKRELVMDSQYGVTFTALEGDDGSREIVSVTSGILMNDQSRGRLRVREYVNGAVHATAPEPFYDSGLKQTCHPARDASGNYRCAITSVSDEPPRTLTHDSTCTTGLVPASYTTGFIINETPSLIDGVPELAPIQYHCPYAEPGVWYELVDAKTCVAISKQRLVYPCMANGLDEFAKLTLDRE